jgi:hypothetical protein
MAEPCLLRFAAAAEVLIARDIGGRGVVRHLLRNKNTNALADAAKSLVTSPPSSSTLILTGFPCLTEESPPTETDGPLGALAIARALSAHGLRASIVTDECNAAVLRAGLAAMPTAIQMLIECHDFPAAADGFGEAHQHRLHGLVASASHVVAIERPGPATDGNFYTASGVDMSHLLAPLHHAFAPDGASAPHQGPRSRPTTVGIGDGGNELGMGQAFATVKAHVANGGLIGCRTPSDFMVPCAVSNWGGYALAAAVDLAAVLAQPCAENADALPTAHEETATMRAIVAAGARDGLTGMLEPTVDGLPLAESLSVLEELRRLQMEERSR